MRIKVRAHPLYKQIKKSLQDISPASWEGTGFRSVTINYAHPQKITNGQGALLHGSRWTAPGLCRAAYLCLDSNTTIKETLGKALKAGIPADMLQPRLVVAVTARLDRVLDLTQHVVAPPLESLLADDWEQDNDRKREALCQAFGRAAFTLGFDGIMVPSALDSSAINVVVFPDLLENEKDQLKVIGTENLEHWLQ